MTVLSVLSCISCEARLRRDEEHRADQTQSRKAEMGRKRLPYQPEASMDIPTAGEAVSGEPGRANGGGVARVQTVRRPALPVRLQRLRG
jgi:hypothetical protein